MGRIDQEHGLYLALQCSLHHADGITGILGVHGIDQVLLGHIPVFCHVSAVNVIFQWQIEWQPPGQATREALAHGIRLPSHGKRATTRLGQIASQGQKINDRDDIVLAVDMLVVTNAPHDDNAAIATSHPGTCTRLLALTAG